MRVSAIAFALLVAAGCGADMLETETIDSAESQVQALTVVTLVFNDGRLIVDQNERFTFVTHEDEVVIAGATLDELEAAVPSAARRYNRMTAIDQMRGIDASVDRELIAPVHR